jgi:5-methylcytosine-specific restriction endonuclease McrA
MLVSLPLDEPASGDDGEGPPPSLELVRPNRADATRAIGRDPLGLPVLVLNRHYQPVRITNVRRAMVLLYAGGALALDDDGQTHDFRRWARLPVRDAVDDGLPVVGASLRVPRVIHLRRYARARLPVVRLTRRNVMLRDGHQCQYCGRRPPLRELDIDHVVPRSRGGEDSWSNLVTACQPCNRHKGRRTPHEAGMSLFCRPAPPHWSTAVQLLAGLPATYKEWEPFLAAAG